MPQSLNTHIVSYKSRDRYIHYLVIRESNVDIHVLLWYIVRVLLSMIYDAFLLLLSPPCCYYYYYLKNANAKAMMQSQLLRIGLK